MNDETASKIANKVLFGAGQRLHTNACVNYLHQPWDLYATGYKDAADILVQSVSETRQNIDALVYPIAFLYRHYVELRLKELISAGQALLDHTPDLKHVHRLDLLWGICRKILEEVWPGSPTNDLDDIETCIRQFAEVDPQSMSFRYPATKDGSSALPQTLRHIDVENLSNIMQDMASSLDAASFGISAYMQDKEW